MNPEIVYRDLFNYKYDCCPKQPPAYDYMTTDTIDYLMELVERDTATDVIEKPNMVPVCNHCGNVIIKGSNFCFNCGKRLSK